MQVELERVEVATLVDLLDSEIDRREDEGDDEDAAYLSAVRNKLYGKLAA